MPSWAAAEGEHHAGQDQEDRLPRKESRRARRARSSSRTTGSPARSSRSSRSGRRSSFIEARTVAVVEPSPRRVEPRCGHYKACSPWQDMEYALQLEIKGGQVREIFARELKIELAGPEVVPSPKVWGYRNRARFHVLREAERRAPPTTSPAKSMRSYRTDACSPPPGRDQHPLRRRHGYASTRSSSARSPTSRSGGARRTGGCWSPSNSAPPQTSPRSGRRSGVLRDRFPVAGVVGLVREKAQGPGAPAPRASRSSGVGGRGDASVSAPIVLPGQRRNAGEAVG